MSAAQDSRVSAPQSPRPAVSVCRRRCGFSLLELLVVVMIMAVAIAAVGASLAAGIRVWDVARHFGEAEAEALLAMEELARDLRSAVELDALPFAGQAQTVAFGGLIRRGDPPAARLGRIRYYRDAGENRLVRETTEWRGGTQFEVEQREVRAGAVLGLTFAYSDTFGEPVEGLATNLPRRITVTLTLDPGEGQVPLELRQILRPAAEGAP